MMTTSLMRRTKVLKTSDLRVLRSASSASVRAILIDKIGRASCRERVLVQV